MQNVITLPPNLINARPEERPVDLWGDSFAPPRLPIGLLPKAIEDFAMQLASHMGADAGGLAMSALTVCAAATPDRVQVQVKRHDPHWRESARIWTALIGPPSAKKSPIIGAAVAKLAKMDSEKVRQWQASWARWNALEKTEKLATPEPLQIRHRIEDTTVEALQDVFRGTKDGLLVVRDEMSGWFGSMEKYAGGGKASASDRAIWLQAFNGGEYALNRVGRGVTLLPNLSVSLLGGIQPDAIRRIAADATDDGLLQRLFPIVLAPASVGHDAPMPPARSVYEFTVMMLTHAKSNSVLHFDDGAQNIRRRLEAFHSDLMALELLSPKLASHIGKLDGLFARLCVAFHAIENVNVPILPTWITEDTASRVADFMKCFLLPHALAFYNGILGVSNQMDELKAVASYILAHQPVTVSVRDVQRGSSTLRKLEKRDTLSVLEQLVALNWVTEAPGPRASSDPVFMVNPLVHQLYKERGEHERNRREAARAAIAEAGKVR